MASLRRSKRLESKPRRKVQTELPAVPFRPPPKRSGRKRGTVRPRGRPRKHPLVEPPKPKRKRGRPRKLRPPDEHEAKKEASPNIIVNDEQDSDLPATVPALSKAVASECVFSTLHFDELFRNSDYSLIEVFVISNSFEDERVGRAVWQWLHFWIENCLTDRYDRPSLTAVDSAHLWELRVQCKHGLPCGLATQLRQSGIVTFEYYWGYSRGPIWGGWEVFHRGQCFGRHSYDNERPPTKAWKSVVWLRQLHCNSNGSNETGKSKLQTSHVIGNRRLSWEDLGQVFGTSLPVICAQCGEKELFCLSFGICPCFKGYFPAKDLYDRHICLVSDYHS